MALMKKYHFLKLTMAECLLIGPMLLSGCTTTSNQQAELLGIDHSLLPGLVDVKASDQFDTFITHKRINDYTSRIAHDLAKNIRNKSQLTPIFVDSFVDFDKASAGQTALAQTIKQSLIGQLQHQHFVVIDDRHLASLLPNFSDDTSFAANKTALAKKHPTMHVLSGVMVKDGDGLTINVRVSDNNSQVITAASVLIPYYVADNYY